MAKIRINKDKFKSIKNLELLDLFAVPDSSVLLLLSLPL